MTDRDRQLISVYLPNPRDPELGRDEFYVLDMRDRPVKVRLRSIAPGRHGSMIYRVVTDSGRTVHGIHECDPELLGGGWYHMSALYDNKEDCRNDTHPVCETWETLRKKQEAEG